MKTMDFINMDIVLEEIMNTCITEMQAVGIPVQKNNIKGISVNTIKGAHAICNWVENDGDIEFNIVISDKIYKYADDEIVMQNVKNSIYHELLHTCPNCLNGHNEDFIKWAKVCDKKLGTKTLEFKDNKVYYNRHKGDMYEIYCPKCGFTHIYAKELTYDIKCTMCGSVFIKR